VGCVSERPQGPYDGIVVAVAHRRFAELGIGGVRALGNGTSVVYDIKGLYPRGLTDGRF
jgi:UDP-N-acetyl-D-galactosamine dehydrogenase